MYIPDATIKECFAAMQSSMDFITRENNDNPDILTKPAAIKYRLKVVTQWERIIMDKVNGDN